MGRTHNVSHQLAILRQRINSIAAEMNAMTNVINLERQVITRIELTNLNSVIENNVVIHQCSPPGAALLMKSTKL